ncbi:pyridoxamine 5'-phosphate oxidase family protein [Dermatophilaceae bacterium Sec6.4]|nr:pyridoxamine 5'-phosphate oxidase family protein [Actinomycetota bacterium]
MSSMSHPETEILAQHECLQMLRSTPFGRLAVVIDGKPQIFPVNHVVDHGGIAFRTAAGTKLAGAARQPVAYEIDGYDLVEGRAWSVVVHGTAQEMRDIDEVVAALALPLHPWAPGAPKPHVLRIEPEEISGRRFHIGGGETSAT